jgi:hypothetical protein
MGSSAVVKLHQKATFSELVAREGGFFSGRAQRRPDVFRGEKRTLGSRWLRLFGFYRHWRFLI